MRVNEQEVARAISEATSWGEVLRSLGYAYHGKTIATVRKWAERWGISTQHLSDLRGRSTRRIAYSDADLRAAVAASFSWAEVLRRLGYCPTGGNWLTVKRRVLELGIPVDHFDPYRANRQRPRQRRRPLEEILVEGSTYSRTRLKTRLYEAGLKQRHCELCGQGELWNGTRISLIIDHVNGIRDDHRLENLRIVCPNCAAGLDTHCGRNNRKEVDPRACLRCGAPFAPKYASHRYCSVACGAGRGGGRGVPKLSARRVARPPFEDLEREVRELGYSAVGRKYGVSDNAIRKWLRQYERERAVANGADPSAVETRPRPA
jgi:hypothetical protein